MSRPLIPGSHMRAGDTAALSHEIVDRFRRVRLAAEEGQARVLQKNTALAPFVRSPVPLDSLPIHSIFPAALRGEIASTLIEATQTGGRTFLLDGPACEALGFPTEMYLDLDALGWGTGLLRLQPEVKGAGTIFERTALDAKKVEHVLEDHPALLASYHAERGKGGVPETMTSLALYDSRSAGGQNIAYGCNAVSISEAMLGSSMLKFVPTWLCVEQSAAIHENVRIVSEAIPSHVPRRDGRLVVELRLSPGTVRAAYFDQAEEDSTLMTLCERVSDSVPELEETLAAMIADTGRYLDAVAMSTRCGAHRGFDWLKVGDISLEYRRDDRGRTTNAREYRAVKRKAWYLAKDEIVVRRVGKFFADMESYRAHDSSYRVATEEELWFQHELFVLSVLRDHVRVCTQLAIGIELLRRGSLNDAERRDRQSFVKREMVEAVGRSQYACLEIGRSVWSVDLRYPGLGGFTRNYRLPRGYVAERYG